MISYQYNVEGIFLTIFGVILDTSLLLSNSDFQLFLQVSTSNSIWIMEVKDKGQYLVTFMVCRTYRCMYRGMFMQSIGFFFHYLRRVSSLYTSYTQHASHTHTNDEVRHTHTHKHTNTHYTIRLHIQPLVTAIAVVPSPSGDLFFSINFFYSYFLPCLFYTGLICCIKNKPRSAR